MMHTTRSLSFFVTIWMAVVVAAGMVADALYEHAMMPGMTLRSLALEHFGHALVLGAVVYGLCWAVFYVLLLRPLNRIYVHLYSLGAGELKSLKLDSNVREIRTLADGVNLMLSRIKLGGDGDALESAQKRVAEIQEIVRQLTTADPEHLGVLQDKLADLQRSLPNILVRRAAPASAPPATAPPPRREPT